MADKSISSESFAAEAKQEFKGPRLRIALVGCGGVSDFHLKALALIPQAEVVAAVDRRPERLKIMEEKWGIKEVYLDWKEMLRKSKVDAVDVCTPNWLHAPAAIDAATAGCHVFVEKPMAMSPDECKRMIDASARVGKKLAVGFQHRFHPNTQYLIRSREQGAFGKVMFVKCQALRRRGIPNWGVFGQKKLQGGGPMIDIGVHVLEMAHYVMGCPRPVAASGQTWTYIGDKPSKVVSLWPDWNHADYTVEDLAVGQIRFDTGAILQIETMFAGHIKEDVWNFQLAGEKGGCNWQLPAIYTDRAGTMIDETPAFLPQSDFQSLFTTKLTHWVDACLNDTILQASGEAGLDVQKMIDGIYRSAQMGREVCIE